MSALASDPLVIAFVAAALLAIALTRTRFAAWSGAAALVALALAVEGACFDGQRHVNAKFDASFFVWARVVQARGIAGLVIATLGAPVGAAVGRWANLRRGALLGGVIAGLFGLGLAASSLALQRRLPTAIEDGVPIDAKVERLCAAVDQASWLLGAGTLAAAVVCVASAVMLLRERS